MNIWILNHYAIPTDTAGITRHFDFGRELVRRGHHVHIYAAGFSHRTRREERLEQGQSCRRQNVDGVEFAWIKTLPYYGGNDRRRIANMLSYSLRVLPVCLNIKERPDVVIGSSPHPFAALDAWAIARLRKARFVFEVRDLWPETLVELGGYRRGSPVVKLLGALERFLYRRASTIIVLAPQASDYVTALGIPPGKIVHIPNGVDVAAFENASAALPAELDALISELKARGKLLAAYAGAHGIANALDTIVEAAALLQNGGAQQVHFILVGDGPEKPRLQAEAVTHGLHNTSFAEPIPKQCVPALLNSIDVAVRSGRRSGLGRYGISPNKAFDYMASGKPLVWTANSTNNPVSEAGCGVTVPPEDPREMADAVLRLAALSEAERREMGMLGYKHVVKHHSIPVLVDRLLRAIGEQD